MSKAWREGFLRQIGLIWVKDCVMRAICAIRGKHGKWRRPKGDENKYCRICGTPQEVKRRKPKIAYG